MYKQVETHEKAVLQHGVEITPIATLEDEYGGRAHFAVDDHCYQLYVERRGERAFGEISPHTEKVATAIDKAKASNEAFVVPVTHIFPEAFEVMKTLPELKAA